MHERRRGVALGALVVVILTAAALTGCKTGGKVGATGSQTSKEPYKIGAVLSLTGTYSGLGEPEKNTILMELDRINAAGGVKGHKVEVLIEDDATDAAKAVSATSKLVSQQKVLAIIGATGSGQTMAMRSDIDRSGIPQVSVAGATAVTQPLDKLVFQTPWSNKIVVPFTLQYLKDQGITKVALLTDSGGFGKDGREVLRTKLSEYGMAAVEDQTFNAGDVDMTSQLTRIKSSGAQAVLLWNAGKEAAIVAKNMQQLKMSVPLFGSHGNARSEFIEGAGGAAEGVRFAAGKILVPEAYGTDSENYKVAKDFIDRYTQKYGSAPNTFAGHAYDALYLIVEAMRRLPEGFTAAQLRDEIEKTNGFVGIGGVFTFSDRDHNGMSDKDLVMYEVKGGKFVLAK